MKDPHATTFPEWIGLVQRRLNRLERPGHITTFPVEALTGMLAVNTRADIPEDLPVEVLVYVVREGAYIQQNPTTTVWESRPAP